MLLPSQAAAHFLPSQSLWWHMLCPFNVLLIWLSITNVAHSWHQSGPEALSNTMQWSIFVCESSTGGKYRTWQEQIGYAKPTEPTCYWLRGHISLLKIKAILTDFKAPIGRKRSKLWSHSKQIHTDTHQSNFYMNLSFWSDLQINESNFHPSFSSDWSPPEKTPDIQCPSQASC